MTGRFTALQAPYYTVRRTITGWAVCHAVPGQADTWAVDVECLTERSAQEECAWMLRQRENQQARERHEAALLGQREPLPRGVWA